MPGTALWVDGFICVPLSPFICLPLSPARLFGWMGSFVSLCLPSFGFICLFFLWVDGFICLPLSPSFVSQPGCLARLSGWTGSFVSLCLPSFVSRCLSAWMPGTALWVFVSLCLPSFVSRCLPGCLARLSPSCVSRSLPAFLGGRVDVSPTSFVPRCLPAGFPLSLSLSPFVPFLLSPSLDAWHRWTDSFVSLCLPLFVSGCHGFMCGVFRRQACVFEAQNACLRARVRLIKPQAACCGRTHECFK